MIESQLRLIDTAPIRRIADKLDNGISRNYETHPGWQPSFKSVLQSYSGNAIASVKGGKQLSKLSAAQLNAVAGYRWPQRGNVANRIYRYDGGSRLGSSTKWGSLSHLRKTLSKLGLMPSSKEANYRMVGYSGSTEALNGNDLVAFRSILPTASVSAITPGSMRLQDYPKPVNDNGRGIHWIPTVRCTAETVDRFVREAVEMKMKWVVILNDGVNIGDNDYLVDRLVSNGIMPIMRIYTSPGARIEGDLAGLVSHYLKRGVHYFQLYNEPNLRAENGGAAPDINRYLDQWIPAAKVVAAAGGLPGFGALSPGGDFNDIEFLKQALDGIEARGESSVLNRAWLSMHNYSYNHPLLDIEDSDGFMRFRSYDDIIRQKLGKSLPIIGTEGGIHVPPDIGGAQRAAAEARQIDMVKASYKYMKHREPYNFAYTYWLIANEEGGGSDPSFSHHALFQPDGISQLVGVLKNLAYTFLLIILS